MVLMGARVTDSLSDTRGGILLSESRNGVNGLKATDTRRLAARTFFLAVTAVASAAA